MIKLTKDYTDVPVQLTNPGACRKVNRAFLNQDGEQYNGHHYKHDTVVNKLRAISLHRARLQVNDRPKCSYCESTTEHVATLQVEHYRPKAKVDAVDNGSVPHSGYYWLGLEWSNLLLSCPACNGKNAKGNRFPIRNVLNRAVPINPVQLHPAPPTLVRHQCLADQAPLANEDPILLNPEIDYPENHLTFNNMGQIDGIDNRGRKSVKIYKLDRDQLFSARQSKLNGILNDFGLVIAANRTRRVQGDAFMAWLESICYKVLELDNDKREYCLWGRHINANFEDCIVSKMPAAYQAGIRQAYLNVTTP